MIEIARDKVNKFNIDELYTFLWSEQHDLLQCQARKNNTDTVFLKILFHLLRHRWNDGFWFSIHERSNDDSKKKIHTNRLDINSASSLDSNSRLYILDLAKSMPFQFIHSSIVSALRRHSTLRDEIVVYNTTFRIDGFPFDDHDSRRRNTNRTDIRLL